MRRLITEGPELNKEHFYPWIELELFDDVSAVDKWLSREDAQTAVWPLMGEWTRSPSNRRVSLRRSESGGRLARLYYNSWPWHKNDEGVAELDVTFDGTKKGVYIVTQVN